MSLCFNNSVEKVRQFFYATNLLAFKRPNQMTQSSHSIFYWICLELPKKPKSQEKGTMRKIKILSVS